MRKELDESRKEVAFLKSGGILCEGNRLEAYRFIEQHHEEFGIRWLLRRLGVCPNAYYNYRKNRKASYHAQKAEVQKQIGEIYYSHNGVDGYRSMTAYLGRRGYRYSQTTIHKYMNVELGLHSIVRPKKPGTKPGGPIKCLKTNGNRTSMRTGRTRNSARISRTCS